MGQVQAMPSVQDEALVPRSGPRSVLSSLPGMRPPIRHQAPEGGIALNVYLGKHYGFQKLLIALRHALVMSAPYVQAQRWQSQDISNRPEMTPKELTHVSFDMRIPEHEHELVELVKPNLPWAEDHFQERVSGEPLNPAPSEAWWPFAVKGNEEHKMLPEVYSHTYPERMWPKFAATGETRPNGRQVFVPHNGIRFEYGDLEDVVNLLTKDPTTRQAYLPIWFPEDTGAAHGERVPCTLGYHFQMRQGRLDIIYYMRSCDFVRHFQDDVYMAARLCQWVAERLDGVFPGSLVMHIASLHIFQGDLPRLREELDAS